MLMTMRISGDRNTTGISNRDRRIFEANNYDYLLGRLAEKSGDFALAMSSYQSMVGRGSILVLMPNGIYRKSRRATGNLMLERVYLQELITDSPGYFYHLP